MRFIHREGSVLLQKLDRTTARRRATDSTRRRVLANSKLGLGGSDILTAARAVELSAVRAIEVFARAVRAAFALC